MLRLPGVCKGGNNGMNSTTGRRHTLVKRTDICSTFSSSIGFLRSCALRRVVGHGLERCLGRIAMRWGLTGVKTTRTMARREEVAESRD